MGQNVSRPDPIWTWLIVHGKQPTRARDVLRWISFVTDGQL